jgi:hypothetical protein
MRTFKPTHVNRRGKERRLARWYLEWRGSDSRFRRLPAFKGEDCTEALGRHIDTLVACYATRTVPNVERARAIQELPRDIRVRLRDMCVLDGIQTAAARKIEGQIADWKQSMLTRGCANRTARLRVRRITHIETGCQWDFLADINAEDVVENLVQRRAEGLSSQSHNHYVTQLCTFTRWCVRGGRQVVARSGTDWHSRWQMREVNRRQ